MRLGSGSRPRSWLWAVGPCAQCASALEAAGGGHAHSRAGHVLEHHWWHSRRRLPCVLRQLPPPPRVPAPLAPAHLEQFPKDAANVALIRDDDEHVVVAAGLRHPALAGARYLGVSVGDLGQALQLDVVACVATQTHGWWAGGRVRNTTVGPSRRARPGGRRAAGQASSRGGRASSAENARLNL